MKVTAQLMRIVKEQIESIDFGVVKITVNSSGPFTEVATEAKIRISKNPDIEEKEEYHKG